MWLGPNEPGVDQSDFIEPFELLEANSEEFARLGLGDRPCVGRREEAFAVAAIVDRG
jgi:hypothetical protein